IAVDGKYIWFGTWYGVSRYDKETGSWITFKRQNSELVDNDIHSIAVDEKYIWFGTWDRGVSRYTKGGDVIYEKEYEITCLESVINIGTLSSAGKLYIEGVLTSDKNQKIAIDMNSFYIFKSNLYLTFDTDKKVYKPNELITISGTLTNKGENIETGELELKVKDGDVIFRTPINLVANSSYSFMATTTANSSFVLECMINDVKVIDYILVEKTKVNVEIITKEALTRGTNTLIIRLNNISQVDVVISHWSLVISDMHKEFATISIRGLESKVIEVNYQLPVTSYQSDYATITLVLSGNVSGTYTKQVEFGERVELEVVPELVYPVGYLEIPFEVVNRGKLDSEFPATFTIFTTFTAETQRHREMTNSKSQISNSKQIPNSKSQITQLLNYPSIQLPTWCKAIPKVVVSDQWAVNSSQKTEDRGQKLGRMISPESRAPSPEPRVWTEDTSPQRPNPPVTKSSLAPIISQVAPNSIILACKFYVPAGGTITGSLVFELVEGNYALSYDYFRRTDSCNFKVASENIAKISSLILYPSSLTFEVGVENLGSNEFNGELNFDTLFYQTKTTINLDAGKSATYTFSLIQGTQAARGTDSAISRILYDGNEIDKKEIVFSLEPGFEIVDVSHLELSVGKEGTIAVRVKNVGNAVGEAKIKVKLLDLLDEEQVIWLDPEKMGTLNFRLLVPENFEDGTYSLVASGEWSGASGEKLTTETLSFIRIVGIRIDVEASLDKECYEEGELATFTLKVTNLSDAGLGTLNLLAKVKFNDYAETKTITLGYSQQAGVLFYLPIHHTGQKLNFGIYSENDRAIWLDAIYVREKGTITIISDKQIYNQSGTVTLTVISQEAGTVSLTTPGEPTTGTIVFDEQGSKTFTFKLPDNMLTGTYYIHYHSSLIPSPSSLAFDVRGIEAVIKEASFDKAGYSFNEGFKVKMSVVVSEGFEGMIKAWIDEGDNWIKVYEKDERFEKGRQVYEIASNTTTSNRQTLIYGLYLGTHTLVTSGRKEISIYNIPEEMGKIIEKEGLKVEIMPSALSKNALFDFFKATQYPLPPVGIQPIGCYEFVIYDKDVEIKKDIKVTYFYGQEGIEYDIIEDSLKAYYIRNGEWEVVSSQKLDKVNNKLIFYLPHLSLVGIGAEKSKPLAELKAYPNPAREQVTFGDNLPATIMVRIFNIAGEEVYEYEGVSSSGKWLWKLQNKDNEKVASGIYIYVISSSEG
ncbi:MAG: T9SS type A sorting domain-containing protein, partial [bacterium]